MSTYWLQTAVIGIVVTLDSIKRVIKPAVYGFKDKYCSNTGMWLRSERVRVEEEVIEYCFDGKTYKGRKIRMNEA